jgi:hypothetical protein
MPAKRYVIDSKQWLSHYRKLLSTTKACSNNYLKIAMPYHNHGSRSAGYGWGKERHGKFIERRSGMRVETLRISAAGANDRGTKPGPAAVRRRIWRILIR